MLLTNFPALLGTLTLGSQLAVVLAGPLAIPLVGTESLVDSTSISARAEAKGLYCGIFNTADKKNVAGLIDDLLTNTGKCVTPAKTCRRHGCWNTSAIYVCNDNNKEVLLDCANDVGGMANLIAGQCCGSANAISGKAISGQQFSNQGWNVIVSYGNCNHDIDSSRPAMGPPDAPWGPNGECQTQGL
ncbi:hypothetical protein B0H66DRAFT_589360 [Apodospora peruviana]|uniref:Uncharacterized protein n=1 Tax=Apodospora peruviana TaxID=516989 RepID=A0AAE0IKH5_9PEZI|nr:hypothetical protein B0H66DRAFT_589360 [Apodospora peruviana]